MNSTLNSDYVGLDLGVKQFQGRKLFRVVGTSDALLGPHLIEIKYPDVLILEATSEKVIATFHIPYLRSYGQQKGVFMFEAGRRCPLGPGKFGFVVQNPQENIYEVLDAEIQANSKKNASLAVGTLAPGNSSMPASVGGVPMVVPGMPVPNMAPMNPANPLLQQMLLMQMLPPVQQQGLDMNLMLQLQLQQLQQQIASGGGMHGIQQPQQLQMFQAQAQQLQHLGQMPSFSLGNVGQQSSESEVGDFEFEEVKKVGLATSSDDYTIIEPSTTLKGLQKRPAPPTPAGPRDFSSTLEQSSSHGGPVMVESSYAEFNPAPSNSAKRSSLNKPLNTSDEGTRPRHQSSPATQRRSIDQGLQQKEHRNSLDASSSLANSTGTLGGGKPKKTADPLFMARALYDNDVDTPGELNFVEGDVLSVIADQFRGTSDWWVAELDGAVGVIPANYVLRLDKN